jgi:hypothetical protein
MKTLFEQHSSKMNEWLRASLPPFLGQWSLVDVLNDVIVVKVEVRITA